MRRGKRILISVYIRPDQKEELDRLSEVTDVPVAIYIREAIDEILEKYRTPLKRHRPLRLKRRPMPKR